MIDLQTAACGRPSAATYAAVHAHLEREAALGGYPAQELAEEVVGSARAGLGDLLGTGPDGIALATGATDGLRLLLSAWPLPARGRVGVVASEWGPAVVLLAAHGLEPVPLPTDEVGRLDPAALDDVLPGLDLVHLTQVVSHRGLEQPVAAAQERCHEHGVPLWVDAAQALGQRPVPPDLDATYAPGRKWLRGPRGTGVVSVGRRWRDRLPTFPGGLETSEHDVAARVGLATAVAEQLRAGVVARSVTLAERGGALRAAAAELTGWEVADVAGHAGAIMGLRPTAGQDVERVVARLRHEHDVRATCCQPWRAAGDIDVPLLRLAPDVDVTDQELATAVAAVAAVSSA